MNLLFATQNKHKLSEARAVLGRYGITVVQLDAPKQEDKEATIQEVAKREAKRLAEEHQKPVMVDDTGIFFAAHRNFPGAHPRLMFGCLGYEGLLKLLEGKPRDAFFLCCVAYCEPGAEPQLFEGRLDCTLTEQVFDADKDVMPYERIMAVKGMDKPISSLAREEKNTISHRAKAFEGMAAFLAGSEA